MKNLSAPEIAKFRDHDADRLYGTRDDERAIGGAFLVPMPRAAQFQPKRFLRVIAASGAAEQEAPYRFDHVSVSLSDRCPTWDEMDYVKRLFFKPEEVCYQLHPAEAQNISNHAYCLHIWRPVDVGIPLPAPEMVGIPGLKGAA